MQINETNVCPTCQKGFHSRSAMIHHSLDKHHSNTQTPLLSQLPALQPRKNHVCATCQKGFHSPSAVNQHVLDKHHSNIQAPLLSQLPALQPRKDYKCATCQKGFSSPSAVDQHVLDKHHSGAREPLPQQLPVVQTKKNHTCSNCQKGFGSPAAVNQHVLDKHHSNAQEPLPQQLPVVQTKKTYTCSTCQKGFSSPSAVDQHVLDKRHSGAQKPLPQQLPAVQTKKNHTCSNCQKIFGSHSAMSQHALDKHHRNVREPLPPPATQPREEHTCATCQRGFNTRSAMNQHSLDKHHVHQVIQEVAKPAPAEPPSAARTRVDPLNYRGIAYSRISDVELDALLHRLSSLCHSEKRLLKEGHSMPPTTYLPCPDTDSSKPKFAAIVLDCEMAGAVGGQNELIHLTLVDFLSGDVLQNCLVNPSRPIKNWREDITGINATGMQKAVAKNEALHGWEAARDELWRFADEDTILIGQSIHNDLKVLHTYHSRIVDSAIVTADAVLRGGSKIRKRWGLETLCRELLGIQIRQSSQTGGGLAHDALEDALAARELIILCALRPERLESWACAARKVFFEKSDSKSKKPRAGSNQRKRVSQYKAREEEDIDEMLTWEDVVDYEIWPKSPPDSD